MAAVENQIRDALSRYAARSISFDDFLECIVPVSIAVEQSGDADGIELAHRIDGILAETSSAGWSEEALRGELSIAGHILQPKR